MENRETFYDDAHDLVDLSDVDESGQFFCDLLTRSDTGLKSALLKIDSSVRLWASQAPLNDGVASKLLCCHLPIILRLSRECPLDDVRSSFTSLLEELESQGTSVPTPAASSPSSFFPSISKLKDPNTSKEVSCLFMDAFLYDGRVSRVTQVMADHPLYLECHIRCQHYLMHGDGPLPYAWRSMISVLATARHRCSVLARVLLKNFQDQGGEASWLQGTDRLPQKLQNLLEVNRLLAHQPWLVNHHHMERLLKPGPDSWSMGELVHALVLLAHWHAMSGFVYGCGINHELDMPEGHVYTVGTASTGSGNVTTLGEGDSSRHGSEASGEAAISSTLPGDDSSGQVHSASQAHVDSRRSSDAAVASSLESGSIVRVTSREDVGELAEKMKGLTAEEDEEDETSGEERLKNFQQINASENGGGPSAACGPCPECIVPFLDEPSFSYTDFSNRKHSLAIHPFRLHDYCWEDHGFSLVNRLYSDIGPLLDEKFSCVSSLTYNKIGDLENIDTSPFRGAIFNYIHCIKGIFHDDYNYRQVNQLLGRDLKNYVKMVTCFPERVTAKEFECLSMFQPSEQVHINFLLLEARLQAELLYALRALNSYITRRS